MANIKYRETTTPTTPVSTTAKGSGLTNEEMDGNLKSINDHVLQVESTANTAATNALLYAIVLG